MVTQLVAEAPCLLRHFPLTSKGSLAPCLVAAPVVRRRPRLAGTRQYIKVPQNITSPFENLKMDLYFLSEFHKFSGENMSLTDLQTILENKTAAKHSSSPE